MGADEINMEQGEGVLELGRLFCRLPCGDRFLGSPVARLSLGKFRDSLNSFHSAPNEQIRKSTITKKCNSSL